MFELGVDRLLRDVSLQSELRGKRLGLLANQASMTSGFSLSLNALMEKKDVFHLCAAFGPQHGIRGEKQDNMQETEDFVDPEYGIPVFSLYGETRRPTPAMLEKIDILLVDLQDVGTRIYTFLTTLFYLLEEAANQKKEVWVLDRPNPAGRPIEGMRLEKGWISFVGAAEGLPMRHGMTLGELANWYKAKARLDVGLKVVCMGNYRPDEGPGFGWPAHLPWVNPSPNAATVNMVRCFPGTVLIEGTHLSEGRGTTRPLETVGGPNLNMKKILETMREIKKSWFAGCGVRPCFFLPTFQKHSGAIVPGFQIHAEGHLYNHQNFRPYRLVALWLKALRYQHPEYPIFRDFHYEYEKERLAFDLINGGPALRTWIEDSAAADDLEDRLLHDERLWKEERAPFLLY